MTVTGIEAGTTPSVVNRLIIASNRLPFALTRTDNGEHQVRRGSGGLIAALDPVLRRKGGTWIGWTGTSEEDGLLDSFSLASERAGYRIAPLALSKEEVEGYYYGFSNEVIWPLFHDLQTRCNFAPRYWESYQKVNQRFAAGVAEGHGAGDYIWIHDYHLMLVAKYLRDMGVEERIGFFLHTPFPPLDIFMKLPWRRQILEGLMAYDLVGFQTSRDRNNFLSCVGSFMKVPRSDTRRRVVILRANNREIRVGSFGIGIDYEDFRKLARDSSVLHRAEEMRVEIPSSKIILGVDRLDYSKGIPERLLAFERALGKFPELIGEVTLVQITVPSRIAVPAYERLREEIEGLVGRINGMYTQQGWVPIHYIYRGFDRQNLVAFYRSADVALVTPLQDGMNLVANEYCATNIDNSGVLILSEFAGAARRLGRNALMVNPHDIDGMADAIFQACEMPRQERHARMSRLRRAVRRRNVFWWLDTYLTAALVADTHTIPDMSGIDLLGVELASLRG